MTLGIVVIGRNEGDRLKRCLTSLHGQADWIVYVDSGSTDGSVAFTKSLGIDIVSLDTDAPFTAARARNAGFAALERSGLPDVVQFVDGDCVVEPGWIAAGLECLAANPEFGLVTGWRTELDPGASVYNAMAEVEWHRPAGPIKVCGGDLMVRSGVFRQVGGFNPALICSEDEDFVIRVREAGHVAWRIPRTMTRHDLGMTRFSQWWTRTARTGHGFAEVGAMHPPHFQTELRRVWVYGGILPVLVVFGVLTGTSWIIALVALAYVFNWLRTARGLTHLGLRTPTALHHAAFITLSKLANMQGVLTFYWRKFRGRDMRLIEYK